MQDKALHILLVEDSAEDAQNLMRCLDRQDHSVYSVTHKEKLSDALDYLKDSEADLVLLDLHLPDSKGIDTLRRWLAASDAMPVVVLTASTDDALAKEALREGAQDYLIKGYVEVYPSLLFRAVRYACERHQSAKQLRVARELLIQRSRYESLRRLAGGISHEIKNPLQVILMGTDFLGHRHNPDDEVTTSVLRDINDAVHRADRIITELCAYSHQLKLKCVDQPLNALLDEAVSRWASQLQEYGVQIELSMDFPAVVKCDAKAMSEVFKGLLLHSGMAMEEGGLLKISLEKVSLDVVGPFIGMRSTDRFEIGQEAVAVRFHYTGAHVDENQIHDLFDPFTNSNGSKDPANLLGLAAVQKAVEANGGVIVADKDSKGEQGVYIQMLLPCSVPVAQQP